MKKILLIIALTITPAYVHTSDEQNKQLAEQLRSIRESKLSNQQKVTETLALPDISKKQEEIDLLYYVYNHFIRRRNDCPEIVNDIVENDFKYLTIVKISDTQAAISYLHSRPYPTNSHTHELRRLYQDAKSRYGTCNPCEHGWECPNETCTQYKLTQEATAFAKEESEACNPGLILKPAKKENA